MSQFPQNKRAIKEIKLLTILHTAIPHSVGNPSSLASKLINLTLRGIKFACGDNLKHSHRHSLNPRFMTEINCKSNPLSSANSVELSGGSARSLANVFGLTDRQQGSLH